MCLILYLELEKDAMSYHDKKIHRVYVCSEGSAASYSEGVYNFPVWKGRDASRMMMHRESK